ncbi:MAG: hypothetical protein HYX55_10635 [Chloroflexi bacterium]|nr:hypothetical protein [Chloroflexota bacterium]
MTGRLTVALEGTGRKVFASALEWPGWARSGKTPEAAIESLLAYAPRYEPVARAAGLTLGTSFDVDVVEHLEAGSGTEFGVPSRPTEADSRPTAAADGARLASIVEAAWAEFDRVAAGAPAELRKGPRGGGRDRDKMVGHVTESDWYYAREMGIRERQPAAGDRTAADALRAAMLAILRKPSDGSPLADRKWPVRYAARRIAWHAMDHAWEIEDRST